VTETKKRAGSYKFFLDESVLELDIYDLRYAHHNIDGDKNGDRFCLPRFRVLNRHKAFWFPEFWENYTANHVSHVCFVSFAISNRVA